MTQLISRPGGRKPAVRVKAKKSRKTSSTAWLNRQLNDPYVQEAQRLGYRSRAAFKLLQLDEKFHLLKPGQRIVDLGAAPGGWSAVAAAKIRAGQGGHRQLHQDQSQLIAVDILSIEPIFGVQFLQLDFTAADAPQLVKQLLNGPADLVLSDMAMPTTGHARTDHLRIMHLCELALDFALDILAPGGSFVAKLFQGGADPELLHRLKLNFSKIHHAKPAASRADSTELYLVALGFRGSVSQP